MADRTDYSGPFNPGFKHDALSKDTLLRLLDMYREYILRIDGFWYLAVMEKRGNDAAFERDLAVWERAQLYELKTLTNLLNIHGDDVLTVMKYMQANPWLQLCEYRIDVRDRNWATLTKFTCPTLFALEKEGRGREERQCREITPRTFETISHFFNPHIKITPLRVPPRTYYDDCCCQWEFKVEQ